MIAARAVVNTSGVIEANGGAGAGASIAGAGVGGGGGGGVLVVAYGTASWGTERALAGAKGSGIGQTTNSTDATAGTVVKVRML